MEKLKKINFALLGFLTYTAKLTYFGATLPDSIVIISLCTLYGYSLFLNSKKPDPIKLSDNVSNQLEEIQRRLRDSQLQKNFQNKTKFKF